MMLPLLHADIFGGRRSTRLLAMPFFQKNKTQKLIATTPPQINKNKTKSILIITKVKLVGFILLHLVQLIEHPIFQIPNFIFPNLRCCKVCVFLFNVTSYIGIFGCILMLI